MNQDIIIDILKILKSKKSYIEYSKIELIIRKSKSRDKCMKLLDPTIFEFNIEDDYTLHLFYFLREGTATIFWGDGEKSADTCGGKIHKKNVHRYEKKGIYKIMIFAEQKTTIFSSHHFYKTCRNIINFIKIGKGLVDISYLFSGCNDINIKLNHLDLSNVKKLSGMFEYADNFNQPINDWDTSNATHINDMFFEASSFNQPIGEWDVSNVDNMGHIFLGAKSFNQSIGNWNVSNVKNMEKMFATALSFNQSIENWNVSNVKNMEMMFMGALSFNRYIGCWNISNAENVKHMFAPELSFYQYIKNWDVLNTSSK